MGGRLRGGAGARHGRHVVTGALFAERHHSVYDPGGEYQSATQPRTETEEAKEKRRHGQSKIHSGLVPIRSGLHFLAQGPHVVDEETAAGSLAYYDNETSKHLPYARDQARHVQG